MWKKAERREKGGSNVVSKVMFFKGAGGRGGYYCLDVASGWRCWVMDEVEKRYLRGFACVRRRDGGISNPK